MGCAEAAVVESRWAEVAGSVGAVAAIGTPSDGWSAALPSTVIGAVVTGWPLTKPSFSTCSVVEVPASTDDASAEAVTRSSDEGAGSAGAACAGADWPPMGTSFGTSAIVRAVERRCWRHQSGCSGCSAPKIGPNLGRTFITRNDGDVWRAPICRLHIYIREQQLWPGPWPIITRLIWTDASSYHVTRALLLRGEWRSPRLCDDGEEEEGAAVRRVVLVLRVRTRCMCVC